MRASFLRGVARREPMLAVRASTHLACRPWRVQGRRFDAVPGKTEGGRRAPGPGDAAPAFVSRSSPGPGIDMFDASLPGAPLSALGLPAALPLATALLSTGVVALAEIGDKTQLLALLLAARYRRPAPIVAGILVATLLNHALAGWLGALVADWLTPAALRWGVAVSFLAIAAWSLLPDRIGDDAVPRAGNAFAATGVAFFLAEIGDKTQVATVLLAAKYAPLWEVVAGTTLGMLVANAPVVLLGARFAQRLPLRAARIAAALVFAALAGWVALRGIG